MQRITWSGIAMHEGVVPGHPASHGCIRLTHDFAARLWTQTKMGVRVIVTPRNEIAPAPFDHPSLVALATKPAAPAVATSASAEPAPASTATQAPAAMPAFSSLAPASVASQKADAPAALGEGIDASGDSALPAPESMAFDQRPSDMQPGAIQPAATQPGAVQPGAMSQAVPLPSAPAPVAPAVSAVPEKPLKPGPVSVFVSRKLGKLYVRKGNDPIFDMPITITHPEQPIGTYLFTAGQASEDGGKLHWFAQQVASGKSTVEPPKKSAMNKRGRREAEPAPAPVMANDVSPAEALDRIQIPQEALDRISPLVTPGASLIVSDLGMSGETGKDTDFIILAR